MYGLVNRALQQLIVSDYGHDVWQRIAHAAGWTEVEFVSMERYDDALTYGLVSSASKELRVPAPELLEAFGLAWPRYVVGKGFGVLMEMSGDTFGEFLGNLDHLHTRIALSYTSLQPPSFDLERSEPGAWDLRYYSSRPGFAPMVMGMLYALAEKFNTKIDISSQEIQMEGGEFSFLFTVREEADQAARAA
ncbi:MAG: hypothetical protein ACI8QS_002073 [Planctomycetota bacterium]|jgi:hypothetical protein